MVSMVGYGGFWGKSLATQNSLAKVVEKLTITHHTHHINKRYEEGRRVV